METSLALAPCGVLTELLLFAHHLVSVNCLHQTPCGPVQSSAYSPAQRGSRHSSLQLPGPQTLAASVCSSWRQWCGAWQW